MHVHTEKKLRKDFIFTNRFYTLEKLISEKQVIDTNSKLFLVYKEIVNHVSRNCKKLFSKEFYIFNNQVLSKNFLVSIISDNELSKNLNLSKSSIRRYKYLLRKLGFLVTFKLRYHHDTSLYIVGIRDKEGFEHLFSENILDGNILLEEFKKLSLSIYFKEDLQKILQEISNLHKNSNANTSTNLQEIKSILTKASEQLVQKSFDSFSHTICAKMNTICAKMNRSERGVNTIQNEKNHTLHTSGNRTINVIKRNVIERLIVRKRIVNYFNNLSGNYKINRELRINFTGSRRIQLRRKNYIGYLKGKSNLGDLNGIGDLKGKSNLGSLNRNYIHLRKKSQISSTEHVEVTGSQELYSTAVEKDSRTEYNATMIDSSKNTPKETQEKFSSGFVFPSVFSENTKASLFDELTRAATPSESTISEESFFRLKDFLKGKSEKIFYENKEEHLDYTSNIEIFKDTNSTIESKDSLLAFKEAVSSNKTTHGSPVQQESLFPDTNSKASESVYNKRSASEILNEKISIVLQKNPECLKDEKVKCFVNIVSSIKNKSARMKEVNEFVCNYFSLERSYEYSEFIRKVFNRFRREDYLDFIEEFYRAYGLDYNIYHDSNYFPYITDNPDSDELTFDPTYYMLARTHAEYISQTFIVPKLSRKIKDLFDIDDLIVFYFQYIFFTKNNYKTINLLIPFLKLSAQKYPELSTELSDIRMTNILLSKIKLEMNLRRLVTTYFLGFLSDVMKIKSLKIFVHTLNRVGQSRSKTTPTEKSSSST